MKGTSTGQPKYDKRKTQKKFEDRRKLREGDFSGDGCAATPEQIEKKRKREKKEKLLESRKYERLHRGGYHKTKKGKKVAKRK